MVAMVAVVVVVGVGAAAATAVVVVVVVVVLEVIKRWSKLDIFLVRSVSWSFLVGD